MPVPSPGILQLVWAKHAATSTRWATAPCRRQALYQKPCISTALAAHLPPPSQNIQGNYKDEGQSQRMGLKAVLSNLQQEQLQPTNNFLKAACP